MLNMDWFPSVFSLKVLYYIILGLIVIAIAFGFAFLIYTIVYLSIDGVIGLIQNSSFG